MRTLIYARYSSDNQNPRSVEDQIADCRARCEQEGWEVVGVYTDDAISGAAGIGEAQRPGMSAMLARVAAGGIDRVLAESTSRLARDRGDAYDIRRRVEHAGAHLFTLANGVIDDLREWANGFVDAQQRKDLALSIKRGQAGSVRDGRAPAGLAYGYRLANRIDERGRHIRGLRTIDLDEAAIVLRIFEAFAEGSSARAIAVMLNEEGVPGPRGGKWRASTIKGDGKRLNGMLQNRLYVGELIHNRTSKVMDPSTRKYLIRPNPEEKWVREQVPELRIVSDDLWERVQAERARNAVGRRNASVARRPRHLLSGLAVCGVCGGGWTLIGAGQWGCGRQREGACTNNRRIWTHVLEERVLAGLREKLLDPDIVASVVREYHDEQRRLAREMARDRTRLEKMVREAAARIERLVDAIARGADIEEVRDALAVAKEQRAAAERELATIESANVLALHPRVVEQYRVEVSNLTEALADPYARIEAVPKLRSLIERVVVSPADSGRGTKIKLEGRLANLLALATGQPVARIECTVTVERVKGIEPSS